MAPVALAKKPAKVIPTWMVDKKKLGSSSSRMTVSADLFPSSRSFSILPFAKKYRQFHLKQKSLMMTKRYIAELTTNNRQAIPPYSIVSLNLFNTDSSYSPR
jgi:hypothetical protein